MNYADVGGRLVAAGTIQGLASLGATEDYWDFGWLPPWSRTEEDEQAKQAAEATFVPFSIQGAIDQSAVEKVDFTELWRHPSVVAALGFAFPGFWQLTGSCVGVGGGNVTLSLAAWEVLRLNDPEQIFVPWWPFTYGRSRGNSPPGDGSMESTWANAAKHDGILDSRYPGLPTFKRLDGGLQLPATTETQWSAGSRPPCSELVTEGRKHLIKTVGIPRDSNGVRDALLNGYPCGEGSMYGFDVTGMGPDGEPLAKRGPKWSHKMSILGWRKSDNRFKIVNTWGKVHAGFNWVWVPSEDIDWICQDECRCYSQFDGFPAQTFKWDI